MTDQSAIHWPLPASRPALRVCPPSLNLAADALGTGAPDRIALRHRGGTLTFAQLRDEVAAVGAGLRQHGLAVGDSVLILGQNRLETVLAILGAVWAGIVPALANSSLQSIEIARIASNARVRWVMADEAALPAVRSSEQSGRAWSTLVALNGQPESDEIPFSDLRAPGEPPVRLSSDERAFLVYSSGTTGAPKGIVHAHRWMRTMGDPIAARNAYTTDDVVLATGEFSFVAALGSGLLHPLRAGASAVLLDGRARPTDVLDRIERHRVTVLYAVPTLFRMLLENDDALRSRRLSSLRYVSSTGEPLGTTGAQWVERTGCPVYESYGISEMQMVVANGPDLPVKLGSVGKVLPGIDGRLLGEDGEPVGPHEIGRLAFPADDPGLSLGYNGQDAVWERCFSNGWFHTEDLFTYDEDGYLWHVGRIGDTFKSRGYMIAPAEIEACLNDHPSVRESAVVDVRDPIIGNRVVAAVVPSHPVDPAGEFEQVLRAYLSTRLAPYKLPKELFVTEQLPRSAQGKLLRRKVKDLLTRERTTE